MASQAVTPEKIAPLDQRPSPKFSHSSSASAEDTVAVAATAPSVVMNSRRSMIVLPLL
jgi:hypothetical protein